MVHLYCMSKLVSCVTMWNKFLLVAVQLSDLILAELSTWRFECSGNVYWVTKLNLAEG